MCLSELYVFNDSSANVTNYNHESTHEWCQPRLFGLHARAQCSLERWRELYCDEAPWLMLWALCVGALAAFRFPDRIFFEKRLMELVQKHEERLKSRAKATTILEDFKRSQKVCGDGTAMLWAAVGK